ncbi:DUF397 domain-containing protein [Embleya sp. NPDC059237]|uniref:DUF397 domain-containing protein n=1 Tax=Embleya sp. NPDC059237 TaxID=3346784 RepID=UPI00369AF98A
MSLEPTAWRRSSYSGGTGGNCVESATNESRALVRDSKLDDSPVHVFTAQAWAAMTNDLRTGFRGREPRLRLT